MRKVCHPYYGNNGTGKEDPVDITSSTLSDLSDAPGVMVEEVHGGVDISKEATGKMPKYAVPDTREHSIGDHLSCNTLDILSRIRSVSVALPLYCHCFHCMDIFFITYYMKSLDKNKILEQSAAFPGFSLIFM